jgi:hypothetical protein
MREQILAEIKRMAAANGKPPGKLAFSRATGIREHHWSGIFWARWSDALVEAGLERNVLQGRFATEDVLAQIVVACRHYRRMPSSAQLRLYGRHNPSFPSHNAITNHFPKRAALLSALIRYCHQRDEFRDIRSMLPDEVRPESNSLSTVSKQSEGYVYLLKSGIHYKIGRSDDLERRIKEIRVALPETVSLVHTIRTDDPSGIEAYWHKRFVDLRANGEWFRLGANELAAFKKRKFQ